MIIGDDMDDEDFKEVKKIISEQSKLRGYIIELLSTLS
jgi:hypothetical protein